MNKNRKQAHATQKKPVIMKKKLYNCKRRKVFKNKINRDQKSNDLIIKKSPFKNTFYSKNSIHSSFKFVHFKINLTQCRYFKLSVLQITNQNLFILFNVSFFIAK